MKPMNEWMKGQGVFVPCLDPAPVLKLLQQEARLTRFRVPIQFAVGVRDGKFGVLAYRRPT